MKVESMQSPVAKFEITFLNRDYVEIDFFTNVEKKQKKGNENSEKLIDYYEYDNYKIKVRNRANLIDIIDSNYNQWLQYAIKNDDREHIPTELELVQIEYAEWETMDTPSTVEEMKQQDPAMAEEFLNMMIELRSLIYTLSTDVQPLAEDRAVGFAALTIPQPSEKLKEFKNRFKLTK